ncbi:MAG TPA: DUF6074 family protein [Beijerinckiaceae bacterium]|jgi:hypothetical protein
MATTLPFPADRRAGAVRRLAAQILNYNRDGGEKLLQARLRKHAACLAGKGIDPELIAEDVRRFEGAVRARLWEIMLRDGGAA